MPFPLLKHFALTSLVSFLAAEDALAESAGKSSRKLKNLSRIQESHGQTISVDSIPGHGTSFRIKPAVHASATVMDPSIP